MLNILKAVTTITIRQNIRYNKFIILIQITDRFLFCLAQIESIQKFSILINQIYDDMNKT